MSELWEFVQTAIPFVIIGACAMLIGYCLDLLLGTHKENQ